MKRYFWNNYTDIYDIYKNGTKIKRVYGKRKAREQAELIAGNLFSGTCHVDLVNIHTGEIIWSQ